MNPQWTQDLNVKKKWNHKSTRRKSGKILLWAGCREMAFLTMMQSPDLIKEGIEKSDYIKKKTTFTWYKIP